MRSKPVMTLTPESIVNLRNSCIARGQSENTAKAYSTDMRMFVLWLSKKGETSPISMETDYEHLAAAWLNESMELAPKTVGRRLTSLRAYARFAGWPGMLEEYKAPTPGKSIPHPLPERLAGLEAMCSVASNPEQEALVGACGFIGMRLHEALDFHYSRLDVKNMIVDIRGKGKKQRFVPVSERAWGAISVAYVRAMGSPDGKLIHYQDRSARKCITSMGRKAGISRAVASHDLRATYATILDENGVPQRVIQELLGHAHGSTTEIYLGMTMQRMREAVDF